MTCSDVITETAHVHFQTKMTISKMDSFFLAEYLAAIFLLNSADFLLVPNCLNLADKSQSYFSQFCEFFVN